MLDIAVIGVLSVFFEVGWFGAFLAYGFLTRKRKDLGLVSGAWLALRDDSQRFF
jgi:hypothetical protein